MAKEKLSAVLTADEETTENLSQEKELTVKDFEAIGWKVSKASNQTWQAEKHFTGDEKPVILTGFFSTAPLLAEMSNSELDYAAELGRKDMNFLDEPEETEITNQIEDETDKPEAIEKRINGTSSRNIRLKAAASN
jgi:hypothetical protein